MRIRPLEEEELSTIDKSNCLIRLRDVYVNHEGILRGFEGNPRRGDHGHLVYVSDYRCPASCDNQEIPFMEIHTISHAECAHAPAWEMEFEYCRRTKTYRLAFKSRFRDYKEHKNFVDHTYLDMNGDFVVEPSYSNCGEVALGVPIRLAHHDQWHREYWSDKVHRTITEGARYYTIEYDEDQPDHDSKSARPKEAKKLKRPNEPKEPEKSENLGELEEPKKATKCKEQKGDNTMKNMFDFTMHQIDDGSVASTVLGVAVKVGDSWRIYDKDKKAITDLGDLQLGDFPIWVIPAFKLAAGDIITENGKYYCVTGENSRIQTVDIATGRTHSVVPVKNILGFSVYQKVVAITDVLDIDANSGDLLDSKSALMLAMMSGTQSGNNGMQNLLPLLLLGGDDNLGDNKLLLLAMMGGMNGGGDQQNGFMQLLLMKNLLGSEFKFTDK